MLFSKNYFNRLILCFFLLINSTQVNGARPTHLTTAATKGYIDVVSVLLKYTDDINSQDEDGNTTLMAAIQGVDSDSNIDAVINIEKNRKDIVSLLLTHNANVNIKNKNNNTALMLAIEKRYTDLIPLLLAKNPDLEIKNDDGYTALILSTEIPDKTIPELILSKKPIASLTLIESAILNHKSIVKKLLTKNEAKHKNHDEINQALLFESSMGWHNRFVVHSSTSITVTG